MTLPLPTALAQATEGSRELDARIALAIGWTRGEPWDEGWETLAEAHARAPEDLTGLARAYDVPRWTTSFDDARTLLPHGFAIDSMSVWPTGSCLTVIGTHERDGEVWHNVKDGRWCAEGPTPALALCAAALLAIDALRARQGAPRP